MNAFQDHALADMRHAERYRRTGPSRMPTLAARERFGVLLVEAGLHLMVRGDRPGPAQRR